MGNGQRAASRSNGASRTKNWMKWSNLPDGRREAEWVEVCVVEPPVCCGGTPQPVSSTDGFDGDLRCKKCDALWQP